MSAEGNGNGAEQTPPAVANNDHVHSKGPAPKAPGHKSKSSVNMMPKERDPRKLNQYLMIYMFTKLWCYRILSLIFAIPFSIFWAILVGLFSFLNIWIFVPTAKILRIPMFAFEQVMKTTMDTFVSPTTYALGRVFSPITKKSNETSTKADQKTVCCNDVHLA